MTTRRQIEPHEGVAGLHQRKEHSLVGLRAGMRLHIGEFAVEQPFGAIDRQFLGDIDILTTAVVTAPRITFGIFICEDRSLCFQHGAADLMFSDAISSILSKPRCRSSSSATAFAISGSAAASPRAKKPSFCGCAAPEIATMARLTQYVNRTGMSDTAMSHRPRGVGVALYQMLRQCGESSRRSPRFCCEDLRAKPLMQKFR